MVSYRGKFFPSTGAHEDFALYDDPSCATQRVLPNSGSMSWSGWVRDFANTAHTATAQADATALPPKGDINPQQLEHTPFTVP